MAAFKVKNLWTAFITAFFALLASVGLTSAATATQQPAVQTPDEPGRARPQQARAIVPAQSTGVRTNSRWAATARDRSLPPTIKQRIRAEAHGSSPATRHLPPLDTDGSDGAGTDSAADGSPNSASNSASAPVADPALAAA